MLQRWEKTLPTILRPLPLGDRAQYPSLLIPQLNAKAKEPLKVQLENLQLDFLKLENKVRFILGVVNGEIIVNNRKHAEFLTIK